MKISHLQENLTPSSAPSASVPGPKFGRSDEMLESGTVSSASTTTAGVIATGTGEQRKGKKSIFQGIKNAGGFANSRKAGISEDAINEDDLSEENLLAKQRQEEFRFKRSADRDIGNKPMSRDIMAKETKTMASGPDNVSTSGVDYSLTGNDFGKFDVARGSVVSKDSSNSTPVSATPKPGSWQEIAALNNIIDPRKLQAGSRIELPNGESMYVNPGDTLSSIAKRLRSPERDTQYGEPGSSTVTKPAMYVGGVNKRMAGPAVRPDSASTKDTSVALPRYPDSVYDYKPEVSTSSPNTIHPPGTSITAKIRDPKAPSWPLDVNLTKDADGNWRNEKGQVHNFRVPGDKEQLEKMPALPPNQSSAETKRLASIPKNKQPDIHSQAAQDAQWEKDKENMGNAWDEFKGWVKKPRSFTIVPGKGKPAFDPDPTHAVGRQIIPSNGQNIGLWPDELVDRYKSMTGAKDDTKSKDDTKIKQKSTTDKTSDKTSSVDPKLSTYHKVIAGIESGNRNFDKNGNPVVSPKGAKFAMQVMPKTNKDPAYGVVPAKDDSPEESNRVGRDYFDAMMKKYDGDTQKASAAYNAGPGRLDRVLTKAEKNGKDWRNLLPRETRNYLKKFNKGIKVASNNDDSMNEDISQKYARDYEYILEYLLSEGRIMSPQEKSDFNSQADYGGEDPDARDAKGNLKRSTSPGLGGNIDIGGVDIPIDAVDAGLGSMGAVAAMGSMKGGGLRPGLQKQQAQQNTTAEFDKFLKGGSGKVFDPQNKLPTNTSATPKVMRGRNDPGFDPNLSTKGTMTGPNSPVDAKVKPDSAVSTYNPKTKTWSPGPDPAIKSPNVNVKPVNTTPKYDPKLDASNYNARGDYVGPPGTNTMTDKGKTNAGSNLRPGKQRIKDKEDREEAQRKDPDNWFKSQMDPGLPNKSQSLKNKPEVNPNQNFRQSIDAGDFYPEGYVNRLANEYEQILESMINRLSLSEERTETKNEKGEVTSWRDDSDWRKVGKNKNGRGRVTNLSDKARRETEKLTQNRQKKADDAAKRFMQGVAEGSEEKDNLIWTLNSFGYYSDNSSVYVNDDGDKIVRVGSEWKHQSGKRGRGPEELGNFLSSIQGVAEGLNEFAPGNGGGESGRWYTDDQMTDIVGDGWYQDLDVSGDIPKQQMIQQAQAWLADQGYSVQVLNCKVNDDDMEWYIEGSFQNSGFAKKGMAEAQLDELSKDTIKNYVKAQPTRIKGPTGLATTNPKKAARIVDTEKGDIRRALTKLKDPAYGQQGVAEMNVGKRKPKPDSYHINKDGKLVSLASYGDKDSAIKDRNEKHPGAEVHQVGSRGKVKGKFEEATLEEEKPGLWPNIHAKRDRIKHGSGEKMRKPGSKGAPTADALRKSAK